MVEKGDTFRAENSIRDYDESPIDPDSHIIKLLRPDGSQEGGDYTSPTKTGTGEYQQDLAIPAGGPSKVWRVEWRVYIAAEQSTTTILVVVSPYCIVSDVRLIIRTSLTDDDITNIIVSSDAEIDRRVGLQDPSDRLITRLSVLLTARTIKTDQPQSQAIGEYREDSGNVLEVWEREIDRIYRMYKGVSVKSSKYRHIDENTKYPEGALN